MSDIFGRTFSSNFLSIITHIMKGIIFYLWMVLCSGWSVAQSLEGNWQGTLSAQSTEIGMNFHFYQEDGSWKGYLDIPQQGLKKFALQEVSFEDDSLYINMPQLGAQYSGALQEDRKTIKIGRAHV